MSVFNQSRSNVVRLIFAGMFLVIAAQLFHLQIISKTYKERALENALFRKSIYPTRGIIYDRKGRAILNNTILYDLMVTPAQVKNIDTAYFCQLLDIDTAEFRSRVIDARIKNGPFRPTMRRVCGCLHLPRQPGEGFRSEGGLGATEVWAGPKSASSC